MQKIKVVLVFVAAYILLIKTVECRAASDDGSDYYVIYENDSDDNITIEIGKQETLINQAYGEIDLDNLDFFPMQIRTHFSFYVSDADTLDNEVKRELLYFGYAQIIDETIATAEELEAQEHAVSNRLGGWEETVNNQDKGDGTEIVNNQNKGDDPEKDLSGISKNDGSKEQAGDISAMFSRIADYCIHNYQFIISTIISCGICGMLYKRFKTRKKKLFLGGANGCGKTTLKILLSDPSVSVDDLLKQSPTMKLNSERIIRDDNNKRLILKIDILDPPGHELHYVIDKLSKFHKAWWHKYVVIIILAPTKANRGDLIDNEYIEQQYQMLKNLWVPVLHAKSIVTLETVVLFLNKGDLFDDVDELNRVFHKHINLMKRVSAETKKNVEVINGSIVSRVGITRLDGVLKGR